MVGLDDIFRQNPLPDQLKKVKVSPYIGGRHMNRLLIEGYQPSSDPRLSGRTIGWEQEVNEQTILPLAQIGFEYIISLITGLDVSDGMRLEAKEEISDLMWRFAPPTPAPTAGADGELEANGRARAEEGNVVDGQEWTGGGVGLPEEPVAEQVVPAFLHGTTAAEDFGAYGGIGRATNYVPADIYYHGQPVTVRYFNENSVTPSGEGPIAAEGQPSPPNGDAPASGGAGAVAREESQRRRGWITDYIRRMSG